VTAHSSSDTSTARTIFSINILIGRLIVATLFTACLGLSVTLTYSAIFDPSWTIILPLGVVGVGALLALALGRAITILCEQDSE